MAGAFSQTQLEKLTAIPQTGFGWNRKAPWQRFSYNYHSETEGDRGETEVERGEMEVEIGEMEVEQEGQQMLSM